MQDNEDICNTTAWKPLEIDFGLRKPTTSLQKPQDGAGNH